MSNAPNTFVPGDWNAVCDICGQKYKASMLTKNWQGLMVCPTDYEPRQPQDFAHGVPDVMAPPWTRVDQDPSYATTTYVLLAGQTTTQLAPGTYYIADADSDTVEANVRYTMTFTGTIKSLAVTTIQAPGAGHTFTYTVRVNGVNTAMVGTISGGSSYGLSLTGSVAVSTNDTVDVKIVVGASAVHTYHLTELLVTT